MGALSGELALFARVVGAHERAHVKGLKAVLGNKAVKKPKFNFRGTTESADDFAATAQVLEDTGVAAYAGQAPRVKANAILEAALAIHTVEARHASWIRDLNGDEPAPEAFDEPLSMQQVLAAVEDTRFIVAPRAGAAAGGCATATHRRTSRGEGWHDAPRWMDVRRGARAADRVGGSGRRAGKRAVARGGRDSGLQAQSSGGSSLALGERRATRHRTARA